MLAYAGWDARAAVQFWEDREASETCGEQTVKKGADGAADSASARGDSLEYIWKSVEEYVPFREWWSNRFDSMQKGGTWFTKSDTGPTGTDGNESHGTKSRGGVDHPISAERVRRLRKELDRWEGERQKYIKNLELQPH